MTTDQMRDEFEAWAKAELGWPDQYFRIDAVTGDYFYRDTNNNYRMYQAAYAAGRQAEREAIQKEALQQLVDDAQKLDMGY